MRPLVRDYLMHLGISVGISLVAAQLVPQISGSMRWVSVPIFAFPFSVFMFLLAHWALPRTRHRSFLVTIARQAGAFLGAVTLAFSTSVWMFVAIANGVSPFDPEYLAKFFTIFLTGGPLVAVGLGFLLALLISAVGQVSRKMGPGVLWHWISGRYHEPSEEPRIFMFLDLKDSTTLAERLGNLEFSALVRDFFADLTGPITQTRGEVSHYIGDEAVLTWTMPRGTKDANCVRCFFLFEDALAARATYYRGRYGLVPEFKAGMHCGLVVATEVGEVKSEIVYHGDVLNTTARIQDATGALGRRLLASETLVQVLGEVPYGLEALGEQRFKGKLESVGVYGIARQPGNSIEPKRGK